MGLGWHQRLVHPAGRVAEHRHEAGDLGIHRQILQAQHCLLEARLRDPPLRLIRSRQKGETTMKERFFPKVPIVSIAIPMNVFKILWIEDSPLSIQTNDI